MDGRLNDKYLEWRRAVLKRDGNKCQWPKCKRKRGLECHHILMYSSHPHQRYNAENGITLCTKHHRQIKGKEVQYARTFLEILRLKKK